MAIIDDLVDRIEDVELKKRIQTELLKLTKQKKFGLVFENHLPECTPLYEIPVAPGREVFERNGSINEIWTILRISGNTATCRRKNGKDTRDFLVENLVTVASFGESIYPYLKPLDLICNAPDNEIWHTLIEADNYHALQLLEYLYAGKVDCIYIDPPYNTGAKDWKYNNNYVDSNDAYRHSKWLSFIEKRLLIAKKLLNKSESVLIIAIDDYECNHLGCLLEQMFPEAEIELITTVINPRGKHRPGRFARTNEYLYFVIFGSAKIAEENDPDFSEGSSVPWRTLRRSAIPNARGKHGKGACGPNQFYPIYVSDEGKIVEIGEPIPETQSRFSVKQIEGTTAVFPVRESGMEMNWGVIPSVLNNLLKKGYVRVGKHCPNKPQQWEISYLTSGKIEDIESGRAKVTGYAKDGSVETKYVTSKTKIPTSNWVRPSHNGETNGTNLIKEILLERNFPYPKSLYACYDSIKLAVKNKKDALILDFFAGSGTTLHAVALLNAEDGGRRRCIVVTNNEVSESEEKELLKRGLHPGDEEWSSFGIARYITWPRIKSAILGQNINGNPLKGNYGSEIEVFSEVASDEAGRGKYFKKAKVPAYPEISGIKLSDGFKCNAAFFKLRFADKIKISLGQQFVDMLPLLWLKAGAIGPCPNIDKQTSLPGMLLYPENAMAILLETSSFKDFKVRVQEMQKIETVYIVTDNERSYQSMVAELNVQNTYQLYRDYLDNFRINQNRG